MENYFRYKHIEKYFKFYLSFICMDSLFKCIRHVSIVICELVVCRVPQGPEEIGSPGTGIIAVNGQNATNPSL